MKLLFTILFSSLIQFAFSQVNCTISTNNDTSICKKGLLELSISGNANDIQWLNEKGIKISNQSSTIQKIDSSTKFYVINKIPFGNELIVDGGFENGGNSFTSDYYSSCTAGTMPQGAYCIAVNSGYFHAGWSDCTDHIGSGKMLVSDGAVKQNEKIWCQTVAVDQNKDYAFSAWITTVIKLNPPIMQFSINGNLLGQPFQAKNTVCNWEEFFEIWNSGLNTSAEICIVNQNTSGEGNDFGIDDISLKETCFSKDSISITLVDKIELNLGNDFTICSGDEKTIVNEIEISTQNLSYEWNTGSVSNSITISEPGDYFVKAFTPDGCFANDSITVNDVGTPINTLPFDTTICLNAHQNILLKSGDANLTVWTHNEQNDTIKELIINEPGYYNLVLSNGTNCTVRHQIIIDEVCSYNLFIPNAFTPNGDGKNDTFGGFALETYSYSFNIFNKWGNSVFESSNLQEKWDGTTNNKLAPTDVYVFNLRYSVIDIYTNRLKEVFQQGTVTLIR